jgi:hypothetical protein
MQQILITWAPDDEFDKRVEGMLRQVTEEFRVYRQTLQVRRVCRDQVAHVVSVRADLFCIVPMRIINIYLATSKSLRARAVKVDCPT